MLKILDISLTILHLAVISFNLLGWIWPATRKLHLVVVLITTFCWLVLGIWHGLGYCPITDWQWQIKEKLGETNLPDSFITYCLYGIGIKTISVSVITFLTGGLFAIAGGLSLYLNIFRPVWVSRKSR